MGSYKFDKLDFEGEEVSRKKKKERKNVLLQMPPKKIPTLSKRGAPAPSSSRGAPAPEASIEDQLEEAEKLLKKGWPTLKLFFQLVASTLASWLHPGERFLGDDAVKSLTRALEKYTQVLQAEPSNSEALCGWYDNMDNFSPDTLEFGHVETLAGG